MMPLPPIVLALILLALLALVLGLSIRRQAQETRAWNAAEAARQQRRRRARPVRKLPHEYPRKARQRTNQSIAG